MHNSAQGIQFGVRIYQRGYDFDSLRAVWVEADRLGYHSATLIDLLDAPLLECWTTLSALAPLTHRIRLTPLVLAAPYRPPTLLAKMAATLDAISGGRLELGLGSGGSEPDHRAAGFPFLPPAAQVARLEDTLQAMLTWWQQAPELVQRPHPPILIGGHGERYLMRAMARYADIANIGFEMSLAEYAHKRAVLAAHCHEVGRDPAAIALSHNTRVVIAPTASAFEERLRTEAARSSQSVETYRASLARAVAGTPEECVAKLTPYAENGIRYFFVLFPHPIQLDDLRLFAETVMSRFKSDHRRFVHSYT
ncbi:MAG: LLM class flavin-dependent oxidoreductase [Deltaproteobacteria bacterium]|nr:LLM class flavin-dependent oxidoreductase [Deltaproteobacteria bacterium]